MKKATSISFSIVIALAFLLIAAGPASAASYVVNAVQLTRSNVVVVYIETGASPYFAITTTVSGFDTYYTVCTPNGNNILACYIYGQIAQQHPDQTAYIIMNSNDDKAWFVVPEAEHKHKNECQICDFPSVNCCPG